MWLLRMQLERLPQPRGVSATAHQPGASRSRSASALPEPRWLSTDTWLRDLAAAWPRTGLRPGRGWNCPQPRATVNRRPKLQASDASEREPVDLTELCPRLRSQDAGPQSPGASDQEAWVIPISIDKAILKADKFVFVPKVTRRVTSWDSRPSGPASGSSTPCRLVL